MRRRGPFDDHHPLWCGKSRGDVARSHRGRESNRRPSCLAVRCCPRQRNCSKSNKYKTRHMDDIVNEILQCIEVHKRCGSVLGGIHIEVTGQESVTEVLGGAIGLTEEMLTKNYETNCDPRLNYAQGI